MKPSLPSRGPSQRQLKVGGLIRHALADYLNRTELGDPDVDGRMISVAEVSVSPDLRVATVYIMPLGGMRDHDPLVKALSRHRAQLRKHLALIMTTKVVPDLRFQFDKGFDAAERIDSLLNEALARDRQNQEKS